MQQEKLRISSNTHCSALESNNNKLA